MLRTKYYLAHVISNDPILLYFTSEEQYFWAYIILRRIHLRTTSAHIY